MTKTRAILLGIVVVVTAVSMATMSAGSSNGVSIRGHVTFQSQKSPSSGILLVETVFSLASILLAIDTFTNLGKRPAPRPRARTIGLILIASLALGVIEGVAPSRGVSVTPPVSFTFFFGGDTGYYSGSTSESSQSHQLIQPDFFLNLGDISYNGTSNGNPPTGNEVDWCNFIKANVQNMLGNSNFPYVLITGNHEDGSLGPYRDGYIDAFIASDCLPLSAFNSQSTAGNGYINFIGSGLCAESTTCYGKEGYFDYPASNPIARLITITVADTVGNSTTPSNNVNYNYCPLSLCSNTAMDSRWNWLTGVVSSAKNAGLWTIVAFHKPCLSPGILTGCEGNGDYPVGAPVTHNPNYQLETYLMSHGVDVLLMGHSHIYARSKQLTCLGPTEPPSDSKVGITYAQSCIANDGSSNVYTRGAGTVEVIEGVFSQRDEQLNFSRPDINYFAKAMSARGPLTISPNDCCWAYGTPMNLTSGNGLGVMKVTATQISASFLPSNYSHNVPGANKFTDSFVIESPNSPQTTPPQLSPLILASSIAATIVIAAVVSVMILRRRKNSEGINLATP